MCTEYSCNLPSAIAHQGIEIFPKSSQLSQPRTMRRFVCKRAARYDRYSASYLGASSSHKRGLNLQNSPPDRRFYNRSGCGPCPWRRSHRDDCKRKSNWRSKRSEMASRSFQFSGKRSKMHRQDCQWPARSWTNPSNLQNGIDMASCIRASWC